MFSVELLPDGQIDAAVREEWRRLLDAGLPSAGMHAAPTNRPHVTVAVRDVVDAASLVPLAALLPIPLELGGVVLFGRAERFVLARAVVATEQLLEFHRAVAHTVGAPEARYENTARDRWSPHLTLARRLRSDQVASALRALAMPALQGALDGLRVWDSAAKRVTALR
ncbi:2'-5' RNA ligase family protein [Microbacterium sp. CFH 90308]|uniref:2'-5' RNA ligase family protein n=1 Tax=Microbacterium salsuginis TaxID=2722803 RepID=A0ABX1K7C8_9MICO|nr:2'-5' RNA ligase family protein [Microbacterium sp. CFH 90308]